MTLKYCKVLKLGLCNNWSIHLLALVCDCMELLGYSIHFQQANEKNLLREQVNLKIAKFRGNNLDHINDLDHLWLDIEFDFP